MNLEANYAGASEHAHIQALVGSGISFNLRAGVSSAAALHTHTHKRTHIHTHTYTHTHINTHIHTGAGGQWHLFQLACWSELCGCLATLEGHRKGWAAGACLWLQALVYLSLILYYYPYFYLYITMCSWRAQTKWSSRCAFMVIIISVRMLVLLPLILMKLP